MFSIADPGKMDNTVIYHSFSGFRNVIEKFHFEMVNCQV